MRQNNIIPVGAGGHSGVTVQVGTQRRPIMVGAQTHPRLMRGHCSTQSRFIMHPGGRIGTSLTVEASLTDEASLTVEASPVADRVVWEPISTSASPHPHSASARAPPGPTAALMWPRRAELDARRCLKRERALIRWPLALRERPSRGECPARPRPVTESYRRTQTRPSPLTASRDTN